MSGAALGSPDTRLVVIRGNSGSGKSTIARVLQESRERDVAVVGQDAVRRDMLRSRDIGGTPAVGMIDAIARHALTSGLHVIIEGILKPGVYADMLEALCADHRGRTHCYYLDIPFAETIRRHETKPNASSFGVDEMREWYDPHALIPALDEHVVGPDSTLDATVAIIRRDCGWSMD